MFERSSKTLIVLDGAAPEHDSRLVEEFRDYLKANKFVEQRAHSSQVHQEAYEVPQEWARSVDALFAFWNGGLHRDDGRIVHYCSGPGLLPIPSSDRRYGARDLATVDSWQTVYARSVTMDEGRALRGLLVVRASFLCVP